MTNTLSTETISCGIKRDGAIVPQKDDLPIALLAILDCVRGRYFALSTGIFVSPSFVASISTKWLLSRLYCFQIVPSSVYIQSISSKTSEHAKCNVSTSEFFVSWRISAIIFHCYKQLTTKEFHKMAAITKFYTVKEREIREMKKMKRKTAGTFMRTVNSILGLSRM